MNAATTTASELALFGGTPAVPPAERQVQWPIVTDEDQRAVQRSLLSGKLVSTAENEPEVPGLEREWSAFTGIEHCVALSNGTAALQVALSAQGIGAGDDVIVPALTFIASGLGPLHAGARPVFADIDPVTFNLDVRTLEAAVTPRTAAVVVVHLHGLPADMDAITRVARKYGLAVVEDAAQAFGAEYRGRHVGGIGHAGTFSLNATKNLPTCGEGGLLTTNDAAIAEKARMMRQFGETMKGSRNRTYVSHALGWNHKISPVQAAFARSQLQRMPDYERRRQENVTRFLTLLDALPGLTVPRRTTEASHAWHILRFRLDPERAGLSDVSAPAFRRTLHRVLRAEGVPVSRYQIMPLPEQDVFRGGATARVVAREEHLSAAFPNTCAVIDDSLTLQKRHLNPDAGPLLDFYAEAFKKAWAHLDTIGHIARQRATED